MGTFKVPRHVYLESETRARGFLRHLQECGITFAGKRVLDIGCGTGTYSHLILGLGAQSVTGIDIEADNIRLAQERYASPNLEFICASLSDFKSPEKYDFIFARGVIYYFQDADHFFSKLNELLQPSGEVIVSFLEKTVANMLSNNIKKMLSGFPVWSHPSLLFLLTFLYYPFHMISQREYSEFSIIKGKMNTIFFPASHLFTKENAREIAMRNHFKVIRIFPRTKGTDFVFYLKFQPEIKDT